jgi:hypothetical protein
MSKVVDPDLYEKMSEPYSSEDKAKRMLEGFWNELRALRKKYKLPNIVCVYQCTFKEGDEEKLVTNHGFCGDSRLVLPLLKIAHERQYKSETRATQVNLNESLALLLATSGWGSIKKAREYIKGGNVKINGDVVTEDCEIPDGAQLSIRNTDTGEWMDQPLAGEEQK